MKIWFDNILIIAFCYVSVWGGSVEAAGDRRQELFDQAQIALFRWDVEGALHASKELLRLEPKQDVSFYLAGVLAFYQGDYRKAKAWFDKMAKLSDFEGGTDGFQALTTDILSAKVTFQESRTAQAVVHFENGPDQVMVDYLHEGMAAIRREIGKDLDFFPSEAIVVEIYPTADAFIAASPLSASDVKTSGTIALCKYARILLTTPRSLLRGYPWLDTLSHEYVHYLLTRKWGSNIPVWLHEGIAKYLEGRWRSRDAGFLSPALQNILAEASRTNNFVTFQEMHPSFAKLPSAKRAQLAYAQVQTLIEYLVQKRGGWPTIYAILDELASGKEYDDAFRKVLKQSPEKVLEEWKIWLRGKNFQEVKGLDPLTLQIVEPVQKPSTPDSEQDLERKELSQVESPGAREHLHLGDLLRYRGRMKAAVAEYVKAKHEVSGVSPLVSVKLGQAYQALREYDRAQSVLQEVIHFYPDHGVAWQTLGEVFWAKKNFPEAARHFQRAVEINPFNPQIHLHLAKVYRELGRKSEAAREEKALQILLAKRKP